MRATLPDRPGALAQLAAECGKAGVNILGLQVFPGVDLVTDELVLRTADDWGAADLHELVERAGGVSVATRRCTEAALADQPTRFVHAVRSIVAEPATFPEAVAHLFDADVDAGDDVMELGVGDVQVQIRREAPFTAGEHARGSALAALVTDVLDRSRTDVRPPSARLGEGAPVEYVVDGPTITAVAGDRPVGAATIRPGIAADPAARPVDLEVAAGWRRRGIGSRLLSSVAGLAADQGAREIVLTTRADNQAVLPMVMTAGLRGRIRLAGDLLTVRITVSRTSAAGATG